MALTSPGVTCRVWRREIVRVFSTGRTPRKPSSQVPSGPFASQEMPRLPIWTQTFVLRSSCICSVRACRPHTRQSQRVNPAPTCLTLNAPPGFLNKGSPITCVPVGSALAVLQLNGTVAGPHAGSLARWLVRGARSGRRVTAAWLIGSSTGGEAAWWELGKNIEHQERS